MKKSELRQTIAFLEEIADDVMETDVHNGMNLRRIALKVAAAFSLSDSTDVEGVEAFYLNEKLAGNEKTKVASFVKEAVKSSKVKKKKTIK